jgi:nicotinamide-nucleotide amidase
LKSDYAIATTGNAGPTKGDSDVKVGTVCIAIATPDTTITETFYFGENRERLINKTINTVFELLQKEILKKYLHFIFQ